MTRRLRRALLALLFAVSAVAAAPGAHALRIEPVAQDRLPEGVQAALWVRDCGRLPTDDCMVPRGGRLVLDRNNFREGDAAELERQLRSGRYEEVWLASGGGSLAEGIKIGQLLRRVQMTVRVPAGQSCVSACTVAFLGGAFRFVDPGASYEMHAASAFSRSYEFSEQSFEDVRRDARRELPKLLRLIDRSVRENAGEMFQIFQAAVHPLGQQPEGQEARNDAQLKAWMWAPARDTYSGSMQHQADAAQVEREGTAAAQEILMRLERDSMQRCIDELRAMLPRLGSRAEAALNLLGVMYSSRITGTAALSRQTLEQMGIVTVVFDPRGLR